VLPAIRDGGARTYPWAALKSRWQLGRALVDGRQGAREAGRARPGFVAASVINPFGIILGVMFNQHYLQVLGAQTEPDGSR